MINKVTLLGFVGFIEDLKYMKNGLAVLDFQVATNTTQKKGAQEYKKTTWHSVILFGKAAEVFFKILKTGNIVYIEGSINYNTYIDKENVKRQNTKIYADIIKVLFSKDAKDPLAEPKELPTDADVEF